MLLFVIHIHEIIHTKKVNQVKENNELSFGKGQVHPLMLHYNNVINEKQITQMDKQLNNTYITIYPYICTTD